MGYRWTSSHDSCLQRYAQRCANALVAEPTMGRAANTDARHGSAVSAWLAGRGTLESHQSRSQEATAEWFALTRRKRLIKSPQSMPKSQQLLFPMNTNTTIPWSMDTLKRAARISRMMNTRRLSITRRIWRRWLMGG